MIIDDKYRYLHQSSTVSGEQGRTTVAFVPCPGTLSRYSLPFRVSTERFTIDIPQPVPPMDPVFEPRIKGSNIRNRTTDGIRMPWSTMVTSDMPDGIRLTMSSTLLLSGENFMALVSRLIKMFRSNLLSHTMGI